MDWPVWYELKNIFSLNTNYTSSIDYRTGMQHYLNNRFQLIAIPIMKSILEYISIMYVVCHIKTLLLVFVVKNYPSFILLSCQTRLLCLSSSLLSTTNYYIFKSSVSTSSSTSRTYLSLPFILPCISYCVLGGFKHHTFEI